jgi:hypothetical protein
VSFWDRLGDAWHAVQSGINNPSQLDPFHPRPDSVVGRIGPAFTGALDTVRNSDVNHWFENFNRAVGIGAPEDLGTPQQGGLVAGIGSGISTGVNALGAAASGAARSVGTFEEVTSQAANTPGRFDLSGFQYLSDWDHWKQAWGDSKDISPGQSVAIGSGLASGLSYDNTPEAAAKRQEFFTNTWAGKITSGTLDLAFSWYGDPTVIAGKAAQAAKVARTGIRAEEIAPTVDVALGKTAPAEVSGRINGKVDQLKAISNFTVGKSSSEVYQHPAFYKTPEGGNLAALLTEADRLTPDATTAEKAKITLMGAAMGHQGSIDALQAEHEALAHKLHSLSTPPEQAQFVDKFSVDDMGQGLLFDINRADAPEVGQEAENILSEMARLNRVIGSAGTMKTLAPTLGQRVRMGTAIDGLRSSTIYTGPGSRPIAVMTGKLGNRLEGHVSLRDPRAGYDQLNNALKQARFVTGEDRRELLDSWTAAAGDGQRQGVVRDAEAIMFHRTAAGLGIDPKDASTVLSLASKRRQGALDLLNNRMYSAAGDHASYIDPETGVVVVKSKPLLQSQIEDFHPLVDPAELEKAMREGARQRLFERIGYHFGDGAGGVATAGYNAADYGAELAKSGLMWFTRLWKDSSLHHPCARIPDAEPDRLPGSHHGLHGGAERPVRRPG